MKDAIYREDAIKAMRDTLVAAEIPYAVNALFKLPSADRPQGEVDAIDRDALIDYCLKLIDVERKQGSDVMNYGQERVNQTEAIIDYIEHMPHVNADRPQEWIPCSEKLPEADGLYLATFTLIGIPKFSNVESFKNGKWEYHNGYIIAWMPLPKPWKGADDERQVT